MPGAVFAAPHDEVTGIDAMSAGITEFRRAFPADWAELGIQDAYRSLAKGVPGHALT
jgi:hypothetical protein